MTDVIILDQVIKLHFCQSETTYGFDQLYGFRPSEFWQSDQSPTKVTEEDVDFCSFQQQQKRL